MDTKFSTGYIVIIHEDQMKSRDQNQAISIVLKQFTIILIIATYIIASLYDACMLVHGQCKLQ